MKLFDKIFGSADILIMIGIIIVTSVYAAYHKLAAQFAGRKTSSEKILMLPSGSEHRNLIESGENRDFYSGPVVIKRWVKKNRE